MNCGFPNAFVLSCSERGIERSILIALRNIQAGEPRFLWDYGIGMKFFSFGREVLLGKSEMVKYFRYSNPKHNVLKFGFDKNIYNPHVYYINYVLNHPTALLYLHFAEIVNYTEWTENGNNSCVVKWRSQSPRHRTAYDQIICIIGTLKKLESLISNDKDVKRKVNQSVLFSFRKSFFNKYFESFKPHDRKKIN